MSRPRRVRDITWTEDGQTREELPKDSVLEFIDLLITATIGGAGGGTPLDAALIADRVEVLANGKPLSDMTGREMYYLCSALQGENIETIISDPNGGSVPFSLLLRHWFIDPAARNGQRARLDARMLENLSVNIDWASVAEIFTGGVQTLTDTRLRIYYGEAVGRGGDAVVVNRKFSYVLAGAQEIHEWKERGATMRAAMLSLFDDSGDPVDTGITRLGIRVDGKAPVVDELPYEYLRTATTFPTGLSPAEIPTGLAYVDLDEKSKGAALQSLDGVNVELLIEGTADYRLDVIRRQYMPLVAYLGVPSGRAVGGRVIA